jgi:hypothetical protein
MPMFDCGLAELDEGTHTDSVYVYLTPAMLADTIEVLQGALTAWLIAQEQPTPPGPHTCLGIGPFYARMPGVHNGALSPELRLNIISKAQYVDLANALGARKGRSTLIKAALYGPSTAKRRSVTQRRGKRFLHYVMTEPKPSRFIAEGDQHGD